MMFSFTFPLTISKFSLTSDVVSFVHRLSFKVKSPTHILTAKEGPSSKTSCWSKEVIAGDVNFRAITSLFEGSILAFSIATLAVIPQTPEEG